MDELDINSLPDFVWIKNSKGLVVEVAKERVSELLKQGGKIVSEEKGIQQEEIRVPRVKSQRTYLNVEEI